VEKDHRQIMTLPTLLAVYLGFILECLWLWDAAGEKRDQKKHAPVTAPGPSKPMRILGVTAAIGAILIGLAELAGENVVTEYLYQALSLVLMGAAMFFVLIAGAVGGRLLPRVNEYNIISVLMIAAMSAYSNGYLSIPIWVWSAAGALLVLLIAMIFQRNAPTIAGQVVLYVLYLGALVFLTFQSALIAVLLGPDFNIQEGFLAGGTYAFLALHTLFAIRFFVLATSFVIPGNRAYAPLVMKQLYREDQVRPLVSLLLLGVVSGLFIVNNRSGYVPDALFAALLSIFSTQVLFRSQDSSPLV
jgi:hypothetical protein